MTDELNIHVPCPACGKVIDMPADYRAQYGGQETACDCGAMVPIPALPTGVDAVSPEIDPRPPVIPLASAPWPVVRPPVLSYRTPGKAVAGGAGPFADDDRLVVQSGAIFPLRCCLCNEPIYGKPHRYVLIWQIRGRNSGCNVSYGGLRLGIEGVVLPIKVSYCRRHRFVAWRKRLLAVAVLLGVILAGVTSNLLENVSRNAAFAVALCIIPMLASLILIGQWRGPFKIAARRNNAFWITGFGPAYVRSLPSWKELKSAEATAIASRLGEIS